MGLDAYRDLGHWPLQRIGIRAHLRSTYDRTGHNHTADASHYLYQVSEDFNVTLDVEGTGILYFVRTNRWHGSPWHYEIDGHDHVVAETTTPNPLVPLADPVFVPNELFPAPLTYTYATTKGADLNWVPLAFNTRLRLAYSRTFYGTGYYIYHLHTKQSGQIAWDGKTPPDQNLLAQLSNAGEDIAPKDLAWHEKSTSLRPGQQLTLLQLDNGPAVVRKLCFSLPVENARDFGNARFVVTWDDRPLPSIDAPINLFFGAGTLHNPEGKQWLVKALPASIRFDAERAHLACYIPMPFFRGARIQLHASAEGRQIDDIRIAVGTEPCRLPANHLGYLHATYRNHGEPAVGHDLVFLDTQGEEGAETWSGSLIGTSFIFTHRNILTTLEGDPRFYFDDSNTPQVQGTGTEEWGGGGDYWGGRTMTLPLVGHPTGIVNRDAARHDDDLIHSAYRFLLADLMPFGKRARVCFEHGGENESLEHYESVTFWYGLPSPSLILTDTLNVGDPDSEAAHNYLSPEATDPYTVRSRYEWGPDHLPVAIARPLAEPADYVDFVFDAPAGDYDLWIEAKVGAELFDAAVWVQVNDDIGTSTLKPEYMGSLGIQNAGGSPGQYGFTTGLRPASRVHLPDSGRQALRIQPRHGQMVFRRILLGPEIKRRPATDFEPGANDRLLTTAQVRDHAGAYAIKNMAGVESGREMILTKIPETVEIFPEQEMAGRRTETTSTLTLAIESDNHGVLLRRTLDYQFANQRARVLLEHEGDWQHAGYWYLAGSNTVYHSFPWAEGELAPTRPVVITSNRRFRDDEFLLPAELTRGKDRLRLRFEFAPRNPPLLPGQPPAPTAWTEFAYHAYCYVMPRVG